MQLFKDIYQETETWPKMQAFGSVMDIRRAVMELSSNLGEVYKHAWPEFMEFLTMARDSLADLKNHLMSAQQNPALAAAPMEPLVQKVADLEHKLQQLAAA